MGDEGEQDPRSSAGQPGQEDIDKRMEDIKRIVSQGAVEAQVRFKRVVDKASDYLQQSQTAPAPRQSTSVEEQRIRQLVNLWSNENWRVARELGSYMDVVTWSTDEVWEITSQTRWEIRSLEIVSEPYTGAPTGMPQPLLPVWDYQLEEVTGLKAPQARTRLKGFNEVVACTTCNSTGHVLCSECTGRGWVVCPDCKGRMKKRCATCRGRGYVADWTPGEKKPFFKKQAENVASSVGNKMADVFDSIRQQGVPIPNPADTDPASKGRTVPCPDCINGEVDCTCGNGKRVCTVCLGARMSLCANCSGTGKLVRHREMLRSFDLHTQTRFIGNSPIPQAQLLKANGDLVYSTEINEPLYAEAPPDRVPLDVWQSSVKLVEEESQSQTKSALDSQASPRATLQVIELVRISYTTVHYRYADQDYLLYIYDSEGNEKFYAEHFPARWDRIERLFKAISTDLTAPVQSTTPANNGSDNYYTPPEGSPYNITEEDNK